MAAMFTLHCTKKLLDRIGAQVDLPVQASTRLGNWYATALFWKPQMALMVNERTLLPVILPLAPVASLGKRFPQSLNLNPAVTPSFAALDAVLVDR